MVTFESRVYTYTPPSTPQTYHLLAPYWTDLYPLGSNGAYVYYKVSGQSDIDKASHDVRTFANIPSFQAKWVLVVTWSTTPFFPKADGPVSKFSSIQTFKHENEICSRLHVCRKLVEFWFLKMYDFLISVGFNVHNDMINCNNKTTFHEIFSKNLERIV